MGPPTVALVAQYEHEAVVACGNGIDDDFHNEIHGNDTDDVLYREEEYMSWLLRFDADFHRQFCVAYGLKSTVDSKLLRHTFVALNTDALVAQCAARKPKSVKTLLGPTPLEAGISTQDQQVTNAAVKLKDEVLVARFFFFFVFFVFFGRFSSSWVVLGPFGGRFGSQGGP